MDATRNVINLEIQPLAFRIVKYFKNLDRETAILQLTQLVVDYVENAEPGLEKPGFLSDGCHFIPFAFT